MLQILLLFSLLTFAKLVFLLILNGEQNRKGAQSDFHKYKKKSGQAVYFKTGT